MHRDGIKHAVPKNCVRCTGTEKLARCADEHCAMHRDGMASALR